MSSMNDTSEIPYGYCQCGCGQKTNLSTHTHKGIKKGQPQLYCPSHGRWKMSFEKRFWSKIALTANPNKCWEWQASTDNMGYGHFTINNIPRLAHRVAWELVKGNIPDGLCILHNCPEGDNPHCCNPNHLFLGTRTDNAEDKVKKGRQSKGEQQGQAKLTWVTVREIRERYRIGGISQSALAREYGVSGSIIFRVVHKKGWIDE